MNENTFTMLPGRWTLLLTGDNHGLVGKLGEKWEHHPAHYRRVDVAALPARLPESWTAADDTVTDDEIIETVSARYGWNWIDTVERLRKIDFDKARESA